MTRKTTVSLVAAVAFGAIMAAASLASGQQVNQTQNGVSNSRGCVAPTYFACMARCAPPGSTPEQQARCDRDCADREDPMDCQFARRPLNVAPNISNQGVTLRRP